MDRGGVVRDSRATNEYRMRDENARKAELSKLEVTEDESRGRLWLKKIGP